MKKLMKKLFRKDEGQSLVEYALIIGLVAVALIAGLGVLAGSLDAQFTEIVNAL